MGESKDREISSIDRQDLIDGRIVVHDGEHDSVDEGERLVDVLRQDVPGLTIRALNSRADLKEVRGFVDEPEDTQRNVRVFPRANSSVVSELRKCLAYDDIGDRDFRTALPCSKDVAGCPGMVAVSAIDGRDEQAAVSERGQRRTPFYLRLRRGPLDPRSSRGSAGADRPRLTR